jgi:hypothetical protein
VEAVIALDILSDGDRLGVWAGGDRLLGELLAALPGRNGAYPIEVHPRGRGETDSWSFAERGIDSVMLLTLPFAHFHLATDTPETNDRELFRFSVQTAAEIVAGLLRHD